MEYIVGQKVPIVNSTFAAIAAGGLSTQPIVNYNLQDIGITIKMTPRIHLEGEVTLEIELEVSSIAGEGTAGHPHHRQPVGQEHRPAQGRRDEPPGRPPPRRGAPVGRRHHRAQGHPPPGEPVLRDQEADRADRPRHDHHAPHHPVRSRSREEDAKPLWVDPDNLSGVTGAGGAAGAVQEAARTRPRAEANRPSPRTRGPAPCSSRRPASRRPATANSG
ncbi:MAG: hypothetical protein M0C28_15435 [Candidatus Moduliflexus flocculans]|nr:hypothetical protein [Candidatus Moduliflexus flocculans]